MPVHIIGCSVGITPRFKVGACGLCTLITASRMSRAGVPCYTSGVQYHDDLSVGVLMDVVNTGCIDLTEEGTVGPISIDLTGDSDEESTAPAVHPRECRTVALDTVKPRPSSRSSSKGLSSSGKRAQAAVPAVRTAQIKALQMGSGQSKDGTQPASSRQTKQSLAPGAHAVSPAKPVSSSKCNLLVSASPFQATPCQCTCAQVSTRPLKQLQQVRCLSPLWANQHLSLNRLRRLTRQ